MTQAGNGCSAGIWFGTVTASTGLTVTAHISAIDNDWGFGCAVVTGQAATQNGAFNGATAGSSAPSCTLSLANALVGSNSLILGAVANFTNGTLPSIPAGQSDVFNGLTFAQANGTSGAAWAQYLTGMNLAAGASATINDTAPSIAYSMAVAEILAAGATGPFFVPGRMPLGA